MNGTTSLIITPEHSITVLVVFIILLFFCGVGIAIFGKKIPGRGSWMIWAGITGLLTGVALDSGILLNEGFRAKLWMSGWIWERSDIGAITVGVLQDKLGLSMAVLASILTSGVLMNTTFLVREPRPERVYAALAFATAGVALAWISLTPWLIFSGLFVSLIGGFLVMGARWDSNTEANLATRFIWERSLGLLLAFFGACVLASSRNALIFTDLNVWKATDQNMVSSWIGSVLVVSGLFFQTQPFPLLGWTISQSEIYSPLRVVLNQIFPAWAAFALLFRMESQFKDLGIFPTFGWVALASTFFLVLCGLFQKQWRIGVGTWLSAGFSFGCAVLAFSGASAALGIIAGVSLAALALAISGSALEEEGSPSTNNKALWIKVSSFLAISAGTGWVGFVSASSGLKWMMHELPNPTNLACLTFIFFLFILLGWKFAWFITRLKSSTQAASQNSWLTVLSLYVFVLLSLGILWTGTVTGDALYNGPDRVFFSLLNTFFPQAGEPEVIESNFISASTLYWGTLFVALLCAYWTSGLKEDRWAKLASTAPKFFKFLVGGYGFDHLVSKGMEGVIAFARFAEELVDQKIWSNWIPKGLSQAIKRVSERVRRVDEKISVQIGIVLKTSVNVPGKVLQLIQTGDLRWYVCFALGSGFAMLVHFLRN